MQGTVMSDPRIHISNLENPAKAIYDISVLASRVALHYANNVSDQAKDCAHYIDALVAELPQMHPVARDCAEALSLMLRKQA